MAETVDQTCSSTCSNSALGDSSKTTRNNNSINNNNNVSVSGPKSHPMSTNIKDKAGQSNGAEPRWSHDATFPLPKLPVPELQGTMDKYLSLIKTVIPPQDFAKTKYIVDQFCKAGGVGEEVQNQLLKRQQVMDNWANDWWLDDMYLNIKLPLLINSNPGFIFPYQSFASQSDQIRFATRFILGILDFKRLTDTRTLPVERCKYKEKGQPMCMEQHYRLFSSYREPGRVKDVQRTDLGTPGMDYIIVACKQQFYKVDVQYQGQQLSEADLSLQLSRVLSMSEETLDQSLPVGIMTTQARDVWAEHRERLQEDATNQSSLQTIENSLFILCLDKATVPSGLDHDDDLVNDMTSRAHHIIHGQGLANNTSNRWMDKTLQLIVSEDGTCGINMEHSVAEGIALVHMIDHAFKLMGKKMTSDTLQEIKSLPAPKALQWNLTSQSIADIETAKESVCSLVDDFDPQVFKFSGFGREFMKSQGISPDAFIQLALQLTYYKIHGTLTSTYESASVRRFRQGRVDVIRANSPPALAWIKAMLGQTEATEEEKRGLLTEAVRWQQDYTLDAILGNGIDLHTLGLREAAAEIGMPTPELFLDKSYKEFNTFRLSTSQVPNGFDYFVGYGAVVPDGYGCCYSPLADSVTFCITSFFSCPETSSAMFLHSLESSLLQMAELCTFDPENPKLKQR